MTRLHARIALALALGASGIALAVSTHTSPDTGCRIEVYSDGSAEPICLPGHANPAPVSEWPIVRVTP